MPFDTAVLSRVHLAVEFPRLDEDGQKAVMRNFLSKVKSTAVDNQVSHWIRSHSDDQFNGRQIRNVFSAAITLARSHERPLQVDDLQIFWERAKRFQKEMQDQITIADEIGLPRSSLRSSYGYP